MVRKKGMKKSWLACVLVVALSLGMAACTSNKEPATSTETAKTETTAEKPAETNADKPAETPAETTDQTPAEQPVDDVLVTAADGTIMDSRYFGGKYDEVISPTFGRFVNQRVEMKPGTDFDNNIWLDEYESILGVKVNTIWTVEGLENYNTKLNLIITSGDIPDILSCNAAQFEKLAKAGMISELGPSIDQYATDAVKEALKVHDAMAIRQSTVDGKIMAFPTSSAGPASMPFMYIRDDWRKQLGLEVPQTMDDLYNMAKAFKEANLGADGLTYPIGISNQPYETYFSTFGAFNGFGAYPDIWVEKGGKLVYGAVQPEMKTALAEMNKWYKEGLINAEYMVNKGSWEVSQDAVAGHVGIAFGQDWMLSWPLIDGYKLDGADWKAYTIPFDSGASQQKIEAKSKLNDGGFIVVKSSFAHPEVVVKMANLYYDRIYGGVADLNIYKGDGSWDYAQFAVVSTMIGANKNELISNAINEAFGGNTDALFDQECENVYGYVKNFVDGVDEIALLGEEEGKNKMATNWLFYNLEYGPHSIHQLPIRWTEKNMILVDEFWGPNTPTMESKWSIMRDNEIAMILSIISGDEDIDYFDKFVESWNALGGADITNEVNEWYQNNK